MKGCFGYIMDGKDCHECESLVKCFDKWKVNNEPRLVKPLDRIIELKGCEKCK